MCRDGETNSLPGSSSPACQPIFCSHYHTDEQQQLLACTSHFLSLYPALQALAFTPTSAASDARRHSIVSRMGLISLSDVPTCLNAVWVQPGPDYPPYFSDNGGVRVTRLPLPLVFV